MSIDDEQRWIDESLREVRVPRELIERLKTVGEDHRSLLDGALCAVPVPASLLARLKDIPQDEVIDATLRSVPMPAALIDELKEVPLETRIGLMGRSRRRWREHPMSSGVSWSVAAAAVVLLAATVILLQRNAQDVATTDPTPDRDRSATVAQTDRPVAPADETTVRAPTDDPSRPDVATPVLADATPSGTETATTDEPVTDTLAADATLRPPTPNVLPIEPDSGDLLHDVVTGPPVRLGMSGTVREPPAVAQVAQPARRGITPPAVRQYDLLSLAQDGIHPFVSPEAHPSLRSLRVPVVTATGSFESALAAVRAGKLPAAGDVRTEEFLAAVAAPPGGAGDQALGLAFTGGPSPWAEGRRQVLQITVWSDDRGDDHRPLAAENVRLAVTFNPTAVRHYRLLGHEADFGGGLLAGPLENQLRVGDAATVLFEVEFQPAPTGDLAVVALSWRIPNTGTLQETTRRVRRGQLSATFVEAAPSFQLATVAAATAELLRNSPYVSSRFTHRDVITLADAVRPALYSHPRLLDFLDLLDAMNK